MLKIVICDDDAFTLSMLARLIREQAARMGIPAELYCQASTAAEVMAFLRSNPGDYIFFLDLALGGSELNGLDLARLIREQSRESKLIFVTSHAEKSMEVLRSGVEPFDFITKQIELGRMASELARCLSRCGKSEAPTGGQVPRISLQVGIGEYISIPTEQISYVETVKNAPHNICYHTLDGSQITVRDTIAHAQELLGPGFALCHRSTLVNQGGVIGLSGGELILANGERVICALSKRRLFAGKGE